MTTFDTSRMVICGDRRFLAVGEGFFRRPVLVLILLIGETGPVKSPAVLKGLPPALAAHG